MEDRSKVDRLVREYRPTMDHDVVHAWAIEAATTLTALQAEIERIGDLFDDLCYFTTPEQRREYLSARAEKAEASAKAWRVHAQDFRSHFGQFANYVDAGPALMAAHAKLKGEA